MSLGIKPTTSRERKQLFIEALLNSTDKVTKVSPNSVVSGVATGVAKISGKAEKDIMLALSQLFPDTAYGEQLDQVARNFGLSERLGSQGSSLYLRVVGDPGTTYTSGVHTFSSTSGVVFELENTTEVIGVHGFGYIRVKSTTKGESTNVDPLSVTKIAPVPAGHEYVINETPGLWGRDFESDEDYRVRIKEGASLLSRGTLSSITQAFIAINPRVLTVYHYGFSLEGKVRLAVATQNGVDLTVGELDDLIEQGGKYLGVTDASFFDNSYSGVVLENIVYHPIDISFRIDYNPDFDLDEIRKNILVSISKYLDFRTFNTSRELVEWDTLLQIVKSTPGVRYVPDTYFIPGVDTKVEQYKMPRIRGFLILNMDGQILEDIAGALSPVYYPSNPDFSYITTVLDI